MSEATKDNGVPVPDKLDSYKKELIAWLNSQIDTSKYRDDWADGNDSAIKKVTEHIQGGK